MTPLARASREVRLLDPEPAIFQAVEKADALYAELAQGAADEDWVRVRESAFRLQAELRFLSATGAAAPILAGMGNRDDITEIRELLARARELTEDVADSLRDAAPRVAPRHLSDLARAYERLTAMISGWPRVNSSA